MQYTENLGLPIYNDPSNDVFDLTIHNEANKQIEKAYTDIIVTGESGGITPEIIKKIENKVDKEVGKGLSSNDFTNANKSKLDSLSNYTHPNDSNNRHVTDSEKSRWDNKSDNGHRHNYADISGMPIIPDKTSQLTNDSNYATQSYVNTKISEAQLGGGSGGGSQPDFSDYVTRTEYTNDMNRKVDKISGKMLTTNDYTTAEKNKLAGLNNYSHPSTHPASIISQDINNRFVTDAQISTWNSKANGSHTHSEYSPTSHTHSNYALSNHTHTDTLVTKTVSGGILTLGNEEFQKCTNLPTNTEIRLPSGSGYKQIHLFFDTSADLTLIFPNVKWQVIPNIKANKTYEIIFTYEGSKWLGGYVEYGV